MDAELEIVDTGAVMDTKDDTVADPDSGAVSEADIGDEALVTTEVVA